MIRMLMQVDTQYSFSSALDMIYAHFRHCLVHFNA